MASLANNYTTINVDSRLLKSNSTIEKMKALAKHQSIHSKIRKTLISYMQIMMMIHK